MRVARGRVCAAGSRWHAPLHSRRLQTADPHRAALAPPITQWFNGNQTALWTATDSTGNSFLINVHGTNNVVVGDVTIPAYTPIEEEWFCDGFAAMLGEQ